MWKGAEVVIDDNYCSVLTINISRQMGKLQQQFQTKIPNKHYLLMKRKWSSHTFQYDYLVITLLQSLALPLTSLYLRLRQWYGMTISLGVMDGAYKARELIHCHLVERWLLTIPTLWRRVAAYNPNWGQVFGVSSPLWDRDPLPRPF